MDQGGGFIASTFVKMLVIKTSIVDSLNDSAWAEMTQNPAACYVPLSTQPTVKDESLNTFSPSSIHLTRTLDLLSFSLLLHTVIYYFTSFPFSAAFPSIVILCVIKYLILFIFFSPRLAVTVCLFGNTFDLTR